MIKSHRVQPHPAGVNHPCLSTSTFHLQNNEVWPTWCQRPWLSGSPGCHVLYENVFIYFTKILFSSLKPLALEAQQRESFCPQKFSVGPSAAWGRLGRGGGAMSRELATRPWVGWGRRLERLLGAWFLFYIRPRSFSLLFYSSASPRLTQYRLWVVNSQLTPLVRESVALYTSLSLTVYEPPLNPAPWK